MKEYRFEEIASTQDYAKELYLRQEHDFVVFADKQYLGRGRNGHSWQSPGGGLWFSFDIDFFNAGSLFTMAVGVAIKEVLEEFYDCNIKLKWPNDLFLDDKKVGGIICEKLADKVIVGIGINTNADKIDENKATTFFCKTGKTVDNYMLMKRIIDRCKEVLKSELDGVVERFRESMMYRGERCFVSVLKEDVKVIDVADDGGLVVETNEGIKEVSAGEISVCI